MSDNAENVTGASEMRRKAEMEVATRNTFIGEKDVKLLLHELQVHQVELEIQNEELQRAINELNIINNTLEERVADRTKELSTAVFSLQQDIVERERAKEVLRESEQKYRLLFEMAGDNIFVMTLQGKLLTINPNACQLLSYSYDELMAQSVDKVNAKPELMPEIISKLSTQGYYTGETELVCKDRTTVPVTIDARKIVWEGQPAILSIYRDITEHKKNMQSLDYVSKCFNQALNGSQHILYRLNAKTGYDYLSPAFEEITGHSVAVFKKINREKLAEYFHHDDIAPVLTIIDEACRLRTGPEVKISLEYRLRKADGSYCWLFDSTTAYFNDDDDVEYFFGSAYDITDRKKVEEEKLLLERQFLQAQKLESLGIMAGGIAHDFNNLLQSIMGEMELAERSLASDPNTRQYISDAMNAAKRAAHLTDLMLTYVGKGFITKIDLNLNNIIREYVELLRSAATTSVAIELSDSAELPHIHANETQIQQVVMNLIINAAEAIDKLQGQVRITTGTMDCDHKYLSASTLAEKVEPGTYVYLDIEDNGCGMGEEILKRFFDPFFTTKSTGRGLGMPAVMGIIKSHNGALMVESELGKGTIFRALFPVSPTSSSSKANELDPPPDRQIIPLDTTRLGTVLVVDDEKNVLKTSAKMVELIGYKVITARDGLDAIAKYREHQDEISLVLMDLTMPNMDGLTAMAEIYGIRPTAKVILSSGFNKEEMKERITSKVPSGFIRKPFTMSDLEAELQSIEMMDAG